MSATQYFPLPPELFAHACQTVSKRVSQLPFLRSGVNVTGELVGVTMECLNAEPSRALASRPRGTHPGGVADGLDLCLEQRLESREKRLSRSLRKCCAVPVSPK